MRAPVICRSTIKTPSHLGGRTEVNVQKKRNLLLLTTNINLLKRHRYKNKRDKTRIKSPKFFEERCGLTMLPAIYDDVTVHSTTKTGTNLSLTLLSVKIVRY